MEPLPVRVLHVFGRLGLGGAETRTVDLYRAINREQVQFDFLVHMEEEDYYDRTVTDLGAHIYRVPRFVGTNLRAYRDALDKLFRNHAGTWAVVHGHMTSTASVYLPLAKRHGVPRTIAHARSAGTEPGIKTLATKWYEHPLRRHGVCDYRFAVSREAGLSVFGTRAVKRGEVQVITNAIDTGRVAYDAGLRERLRAELGLRHAFVIGHAGSFVFAKNHSYLLQVFSAYRRLTGEGTERVVLMLAGSGELMDDIREQAVRAGLEQDVLFLGSRSDMNACYAAMDLFVYPSHYEGLPGVVIEAQASGLPCLISDRITEETDVTPLVQRMSIDKNPAEWARVMREMAGERKERGDASADALRRLRESGFDVREQARRMCAFYLGQTDRP